jgi:hypothetical protein
MRDLKRVLLSKLVRAICSYNLVQGYYFYLDSSSRILGCLQTQRMLTDSPLSITLPG